MNEIANLTTLQRLILALLEEAGEEDVVCLTNTIKPGEYCGNPQEIEAITSALAGLIDADLVRTAISRDLISGILVPQSMPESLVSVQNLTLFFQWSSTEKLWHWSGRAPLPDVVATERGLAAARKVLAKDGWPADLG